VGEQNGVAFLLQAKDLIDQVGPWVDSGAAPDSMGSLRKM
jgi:hypothetical protein